MNRFSCFTTNSCFLRKSCNGTKRIRSKITATLISRKCKFFWTNHIRYYGRFCTSISRFCICWIWTLTEHTRCRNNSGRNLCTKFLCRGCSCGRCLIQFLIHHFVGSCGRCACGRFLFTLRGNRGRFGSGRSSSGRSSGGRSRSCRTLLSRGLCGRGRRGRDFSRGCLR